LSSHRDDLPEWRVPRLPAPARSEGPLADLPWSALPPLPPFLLSDGSGEALQPTTARLAWDDAALYARFDCQDRDAWGTFTRRDEPLYEEEVVELFLAPGEATPARYAELEVSPRGTLFDAWVETSDGRRDTLRVDTGWDCAGLRWEAGSTGVREDWWAALAIPWRALVPPGPPPRAWRANLYRIERPRDGAPPEHSAWSPTLAVPPDFHRPERFGRLILAPDAQQ
jgi:hypothetical protein